MQTKIYQTKKSQPRQLPAGKKGQAQITDNRPANLIQQKMAKAIQHQANKNNELVQGKFTSQFVADDEDELQTKFIQRAADQDEELQTKSITQRIENKTGMPDHLKSGIEQLSGLDMSDVHVHYNSAKPANVQAYAYTQGTSIHVAPGQEKHLPHEAWHVAQQKQGRVQPTTTVNGMSVNDNPALEAEADQMGAKASRL